MQFLNDATGNRRWLPFEVERIDDPRLYPFNYEGIYAQAYALYRQGFRHFFTKAEEERLKTHNRAFEAPCALPPAQWRGAWGVLYGYGYPAGGQ